MWSLTRKKKTPPTLKTRMSSLWDVAVHKTQAPPQHNFSECIQRMKITHRFELQQRSKQASDDSLYDVFYFLRMPNSWSYINVRHNNTIRCQTLTWIKTSNVLVQCILLVVAHLLSVQACVVCSETGTCGIHDLFNDPHVSSTIMEFNRSL